MKVLLIDIDSKISNIALKKIEMFHVKQNDEIIWNMLTYRSWADKIYVSCIFTKNYNKCREWEGIANIGGSGYDLAKKLPDEIEQMKPKINIGFTTRGCIRKCPFCIVPEKEGMIRTVNDIKDIWDGKSKNITLLDNNILAMPTHFELIYHQLISYKLRVDFNQGLDIRLLRDSIVYMLSQIRHKEYRFSFDRMGDEIGVLKGLDLLKKYGINRSIFYVLVGFDTTYKEDLYRLNLLRDKDQDVFVQRYNHSKDRILSIIARWANQHNVFRKMTFKEFVMHPKHKKGYYNICKEAELI